MLSSPQQIERDLERATARLEPLRATLLAARRRSESLTINDPGALSGVTRSRRRGARLDAGRHAAYDAEAAAQRALAEQERRVKVLEHQLARAREDAAAPCDVDAVKPGWLVRDRHGWHRVVRVSAKSVSVETPWSWTDRIPKDRIVETRDPSPEEG